MTSTLSECLSGEATMCPVGFHYLEHGGKIGTAVFGETQTVNHLWKGGLEKSRRVLMVAEGNKFKGGSKIHGG